MERKTAQRLLGILVIISLVIILLPLFQHQTENKSEPTLVQAPPFPDQPNQVAENAVNGGVPIQSAQAEDTGFNQQPDDVVRPVSPMIAQTENTSVEVSASNSDTTNLAQVNTNSTVTALKSNDDIAVENENSQVVAENKSEKTQLVENKNSKPAPVGDILDPNSPAARANAKRQMTAEITTEPESDSPTKTFAYETKEPFVPKIKPFYLTDTRETKTNNNGLIQLKNSAWVIQMGSFKSKDNALKLVNNLRAHGYKAFIQQVATNTRVFVGPEVKQAHARALASQLSDKMHMRGIVISYQPLEI